MGDERAAVVAWLLHEGSDPHLIDRPVWRAWIWAMFHPRRFATAIALINAAAAIERGDHLRATLEREATPDA